jgi:Methyltransferase domain
MPKPDVFEDIYTSNAWGSAESVSGEGSEIGYTTHLREALPRLFSRFGITSILDAPCGDLNWMRPVIAKTGIRYHGFDIVHPLIDSLAHLQSPTISIAQGDIREMSFPQVDLWMCRDCWIHLSSHDIERSLQRFKASRISFLLTTTYIFDGPTQNTDIETGSFRFLDLFSPPFSFPKPALFAIDDWIPPFPRRRLALWRREDIPDRLSQAKMGG